MNKNAFLSELSRKLRRLPKQEYDDAMNYYVEYFIDAGVGETDDVTSLVGTVDEVSRRILEECTDRQIEKTKNEGGVKNSTKTIWLIILGIFAAPIAFPIAIVIFVVALVLVIVSFAVIISLIACSVAVVFAGFVAIPALFWAETLAQVLVLLGISCISIALGILMCILFFKLGKLLVLGLIKLFSNIGKSGR